MATTAYPVNPQLTAIAMVYSNPSVNLIADLVMPRISTAKKFSWSSFDPTQGYTIPNTQVGRKSTPTEVEFNGTLNNDEVLDYGLDDIVPNDEIDAWESMTKPARGGPPNPLDVSTMLTTKLLQLDREVRVSRRVFNSGNHINKVLLSGTSQWSDYANSNPLNAILNALDVPLYRPNLAVLGQRTFTTLRQHPKLVQAVYGSAQTGGSITREQLAQVLEVKQVVVGAGFVNLARKGQAVNNVRVWGENAAFLYIDPESAQALQPTWGFTAEWGSRIAGDIDEPKMGLRGSKRVRVGESLKEVISAPSLSYFFEAAVA